MFCVKCGAETIQKAKYCQICGEELSNSDKFDVIQIKALSEQTEANYSERDDGNIEKKSSNERNSFLAGKTITANFKWYLICLAINTFKTLSDFNGVFPYYPNGAGLEPALNYFDLVIGICSGAFGMWLIIMLIKFIIKKIKG